MDTDYKIKSKLRKKYTYAPVLSVGVIFVLSILIMTANIRSHYYELLRSESARLSKSYAHNLEIASEAQEMANEIMDQRLIATGELVYSLDGEYSESKLKEVSESLQVDDVYVYDRDGVIIYSNNGMYIGWKAEPGHPVHDFIISGKNSHIDPIRPDTESGTLLKYGYYRLQNGYFVQSGIKATRVQEFLGSFDIQKLLDQMHADGYVMKAYFADTSNIIIGSTDGADFGRAFLEVDTEVSKDPMGVTSWIDDYKGNKAFFVSTPVIVENETIGTLGFVHSLASTEAAINSIILLGGGLLLAIAGLILFFNRSAYKNDVKLTRMAFIDSLTNIPNQAYLMDELKELCNQGSHNKNALFLINISNFKALNMTFGYEFGDSVLRRIAEQLFKAFDKKFDIFRFASDRFVLLARDYKDKSELDQLAERIVDSVDKEIIAHGYTKSLNINMGIVEVGNKYEDPNDIIRDATIALDYIGVIESDIYSYYDESMMEGLKRDEEIEAEIIQAILNPATGGLHLVYQPLFDARNMRVAGFEALARLNSPALGPISPTEFIAIAERRRLMVQLGNWIIDTALLFLKDIENQGVSDVKISINISAAQLQDKSFIPRLRKVISETRVKPSNVELEVTESILLNNYEEINSSLGQLRKEGVTIAVDDFGTGYSSFSRLNQLNIDTIKIDKTFVDRITNTPQEMLLTGDIISLCHKLDLTVVAEGVENEIQAAYLLEHECDKFQGYLFSKPLQFKEAMYILRDLMVKDA